MSMGKDGRVVRACLLDYPSSSAQGSSKDRWDADKAPWNTVGVLLVDNAPEGPGEPGRGKTMILYDPFPKEPPPGALAEETYLAKVVGGGLGLSLWEKMKKAGWQLVRVTPANRVKDGTPFEGYLDDLPDPDDNSYNRLRHRDGARWALKEILEAILVGNVPYEAKNDLRVDSTTQYPQGEPYPSLHCNTTVLQQKSSIQSHSRPQNTDFALYLPRAG